METVTAAALDGELVEPLGPPSRRRRGRRAAALAAVLLAAGAAAAVAVLSGGAGRGRGASTLPSGDGTAAVERRTLSESTTVDGTLGYGATQNVYDRLSGTYTWLPAAGRVIGRGDTLFRVDQLPVVLMYGSIPAYRAMRRGLTGSDVAELNANLGALGFDSSGTIAATSTFGVATEAAVRRWQSAESLPVTGQVPLGRIVFAGGARRIDAVDVSLGQDPPPAEEGTGTTPAATTPAATTPATTTPTTPVTTTPASTTAPAARSPSDSASGKQAGKHPASKSPSSGSSTTPKSSAPHESSSPKGETPAAGGGELVMTVTSTAPLVTVQLKAEQQTLARVGERAPVTLPDGTSVSGRVVSVGRVASSPKESERSPSGESESPTIPVTLSLARRVARLDKAPVSVQLVESVRHGVLCVPATALTATAGGGYAVQVVRGGRVAPLAVTPGMFAGGYVEIEGEGVHAGLAVLEPQ